MTVRHTRADLEHVAGIINRTAGSDLFIGYAYGRPRVYARDGAVELSPRLPVGQLYEWLSAVLVGIDLARKEEK